MALEAVIYHKRGQASPPQFRVETMEVSILLRSGDHVLINPDHTVVYDPSLTNLETATERVIDTNVNMPPDKHHPNPWIGRMIYMPNQGDQILLKASVEKFDSRRPESLSITATFNTP